MNTLVSLAAAPVLDSNVNADLILSDDAIRLLSTIEVVGIGGGESVGSFV